MAAFHFFSWLSSPPQPMLPHRTYPAVYGRTLWLAPCWPLWVTLQWTQGACISANTCFRVFQYVPRRGDAGSHRNSILNYLRSCPPVFHSGCTSLHSQQQRMRVPFSPRPLRPLLLPVLLITAILTGVRWCVIVVLVCISLTASEVEHLSYICWLFVCLLGGDVCSGPLPSF